MQNPPRISLDEAQARLAAALNRLETLEQNPFADRLALHRASRSIHFWDRAVRLMSREPYQRALALR